MRQISLVLDSCVVIDIMEKQKFANQLRSSLKGKQICLVLCDVVLNEVQKVRGFTQNQIIAKISTLGKKIKKISINEEQRVLANDITTQYQFCHNGDNFILTLCKVKFFILLSSDRMLLTACRCAGVLGFHPNMAGGI